MHKEDRVVCAAEEIGGVAANLHVASGVCTEESVGETSLKLVLKCEYALGSRAEREVVEVGQGEVVGGGEEVTSSASWVVVEGVGYRSVSCHSREDRSEIKLQTEYC